MNVYFTIVREFGTLTTVPLSPTVELGEELIASTQQMVCLLNVEYQ